LEKEKAGYFSEPVSSASSVPPPYSANALPEVPLARTATETSMSNARSPYPPVSRTATADSLQSQRSYVTAPQSPARTLTPTSSSQGARRMQQSSQDSYFPTMPAASLPLYRPAVSQPPYPVEMSYGGQIQGPQSPPYRKPVPLRAEPPFRSPTAPIQVARADYNYRPQPALRSPTRNLPPQPPLHLQAGNGARSRSGPAVDIRPSPSSRPGTSDSARGLRQMDEPRPQYRGGDAYYGGENGVGRMQSNGYSR